MWCVCVNYCVHAQIAIGKVSRLADFIDECKDLYEVSVERKEQQQ